jgi:hypothetical protein
LLIRPFEGFKGYRCGLAVKDPDMGSAPERPIVGLFECRPADAVGVNIADMGLRSSTNVGAQASGLRVEGVNIWFNVVFGGICHHWH